MERKFRLKKDTVRDKAGTVFANHPESAPFTDRCFIPESGNHKLGFSLSEILAATEWFEEIIPEKPLMKSDEKTCMNCIHGNNGVVVTCGIQRDRECYGKFSRYWYPADPLVKVFVTVEAISIRRAITRDRHCAR